MAQFQEDDILVSNYRALNGTSLHIEVATNLNENGGERGRHSLTLFGTWPRSLGYCSCLWERYFGE